MTNHDSTGWLYEVIKKAARKELKREPKSVAIRRIETKTLTSAIPKPAYKVWANVKLGKSSYEIILNIGEDGSYGGFRVIG